MGLNEVATALDMTELEFKRVERRPAEVPCCLIYRIVEFFGPNALFEAEITFQQVDRLGRKFRSAQKPVEPNIVRIHPENRDLIEEAALNLGLEIAYQQLQQRREATHSRSDSDPQ